MTEPEEPPAPEAREFEPDDTAEADATSADAASTDLTRDVVPTIGNLTPSGLPLLPAFSTYQEESAPREPDPDDPRWEK